MARRIGIFGNHGEYFPGKVGFLGQGTGRIIFGRNFLGPGEKFVSKGIPFWRGLHLRVHANGQPARTRGGFAGACAARLPESASAGRVSARRA